MTTDPIDWSCLRCRSRLDDQGEVEFRTGGTGGAAKLLFGEWAELGEHKVRFRVLSCPRCGEVALMDPGVYPGG